MRILCEVFGLFDKRGQAGAVHLILLKGLGGWGLQRGGGAQANGWAQICAQREREGRKGEKKSVQKEKEREKRREKAERRIKSKPKRMKGRWKEDQKQAKGG